MPIISGVVPVLISIPWLIVLPSFTVCNTHKPLHAATMAACRSLHRYFENPMPENPTLLESLASWSQVKPVKPVDLASFTELFGELQFKEKANEPSPIHSFMEQQEPESKPPRNLQKPTIDNSAKIQIDSDLQKSMNRKSLSLDFDQYPRYEIDGGCRKSLDCKTSTLDSLLGRGKNQRLCTEGLGFESCDEVEDKSENADDWGNQEKNLKLSVEDWRGDFGNSLGGFKKSKLGDFPPPISSIGRSGQPWVSFKSYRYDGRFVLREIRLPTPEFLHAIREDGRLKLHFVQRDDEFTEQDEEEEEEEHEKEKAKISRMVLHV